MLLFMDLRFANLTGHIHSFFVSCFTFSVTLGNMFRGTEEHWTGSHEALCTRKADVRPS